VDADANQGLAVVPGVRDLVLHPPPLRGLSTDKDDDGALVLHLLGDPVLDRLLAAPLHLLPLLRTEEGLPLQRAHVDDLLHAPCVAVIVETEER
jgi:hypothetical protein